MTAPGVTLGVTLDVALGVFVGDGALIVAVGDGVNVGVVGLPSQCAVHCPDCVR
jgi:hypothetical protein